jgi:hypothetical protein
MKDILLWTLATSMILFTVLSAMNAYAAYDFGPTTNYIYYEQDYEDYEQLPIVVGPYPRYYLGFNNYRGQANDIFIHDDFNHYDEYIGYRDLDVYYPSRGYVDVLRNPSASIEPIEPEHKVYNSARTYHVSGVLPNGGIYTKHYYHDHAWDLEEYGYGYGCDYGYFEPVIAYREKPIITKPCQSQSICQYTHCNC